MMRLVSKRISEAAGLTLAFAGMAQAAQAPDILIILTDDLGYGDVQCYNPETGKIPTPNVDRLADNGIRFTDAHSTCAVCSPSRYALLTGRYHWRGPFKKGGIIKLWEGSVIAPEQQTLASIARRKNYSTAAIGKWHLGWNWPIAAEDQEFFNKTQNIKDPPIDVPAGAVDAWRRTFSQPIGGGPLAGEKFSIWEGGSRVPFIVSWPGLIKSGGQVSDALISQTDILATEPRWTALQPVL